MSSFAIRQQRTDCDCDRKPFFIASAADEDDDYDDEPGKSYAGRMSISLCGEKYSAILPRQRRNCNDDGRYDALEMHASSRPRKLRKQSER